MKLQQEISFNLSSEKVGNKYEVLIEEKVEDGVYIGRTYMDSPEIDGIVYVHDDKELEDGFFVCVEISDFLEYDLLGEVIDEDESCQ